MDIHIIDGYWDIAITESIKLSRIIDTFFNSKTTNLIPTRVLYMQNKFLPL